MVLTDYVELGSNRYTSLLSTGQHMLIYNVEQLARWLTNAFKTPPNAPNASRSICVQVSYFKMKKPLYGRSSAAISEC